MTKKSSTALAGGTVNSKDILTKSPVSLHSSQAEVVSYFKKNMGRFISTYEFRKNGISNPAQRISELISLGAVIKKKTAPANDESGKEHNKVSWYLFKGWEDNSGETV